MINVHVCGSETLMIMFVMTKYDKTETLNELNTFNSKIHFTHESAVNGTLPFLEC